MKSLGFRKDRRDNNGNGHHDVSEIRQGHQAENLQGLDTDKAHRFQDSWCDARVQSKHSFSG